MIIDQVQIIRLQILYFNYQSFYLNTVINAYLQQSPSMNYLFFSGKQYRKEITSQQFSLTIVSIPMIDQKYYYSIQPSYDYLFQYQINCINSNFLMEQELPQNLMNIIQPILQRVSVLEIKNTLLQEQVAKLNAILSVNKAPQKGNLPSNIKQSVPASSASTVKKVDKPELKSANSLKTEPSTEKKNISKMPMGQTEGQESYNQSTVVQTVQTQSQKVVQQNSQIKTENSEVKDAKSPMIPKKDEKQKKMPLKANQTKDLKKDQSVKKLGTTIPTASRKISSVSTKTLQKKQKKVEKMEQMDKNEQMLDKVQQVSAQKEEQEKKQNKENLNLENNEIQVNTKQTKMNAKIMPTTNKNMQAKKQIKPVETKVMMGQQKQDNKKSKTMRSPSAKTSLRPSIQNKSVIGDENQKENMKSAANMQLDTKKTQENNKNAFVQKNKQQFDHTNPVSLLSCKDSLDGDTDLMCDQVIEMKKGDLL